MATQFNRSFSDIYSSIYDNSKQNRELFFGEMGGEIRKSITNSLGHPTFSAMKYGEKIPGSILVFFMDIRGFTKISIALENEELIRILQATTIASIYSVMKYGGYIIDFTGDGIMAYFGDGIKTSKADSFNALAAAAYLMDGVKGYVNKKLSATGDEAIKIGIGMEYGNAIWTMIGMPNACQPKPVSEVTYIAGKNSSHANAWEVVVGKNLADWVPNEYKASFDSYKFQKDNKTFEYPRSLFKWEPFNKQIGTNRPLLEYGFSQRNLPVLGSTAILSTNGSVQNSTSAPSNGPRPLKDRPFFK